MGAGGSIFIAGGADARASMAAFRIGFKVDAGSFEFSYTGVVAHWNGSYRNVIQGATAIGGRGEAVANRVGIASPGENCRVGQGER